MTDLALYFIVGALAGGCVWVGFKLDQRKRERLSLAWRLSDDWKPPQKEQERQ